MPTSEALKGLCVKLVKVKPSLCFRPQDVGDVKTAKDVYQGGLNTGNGTSSGEILLTTKLEGPRHLTKPSEPEVPATRQRATNLWVCLPGFQSWFPLIFPYYVPKLPFWRGNIYSVPFYSIYVYVYLHIYVHIYNLVFLKKNRKSQLRRKFGLLNSAKT